MSAEGLGDSQEGTGSVSPLLRLLAASEMSEAIISSNEIVIASFRSLEICWLKSSGDEWPPPNRDLAAHCLICL